MMSTSYYTLKEPVTSIRPEVKGGHTHVGIWINHGKAGTLVFRNEEWGKGIWLFFNDDVGDAPIHQHWGGDKEGLVVNEYTLNLKDEQQMISENGELTTVREIRAEAGKGKK